MRKIKEIIIVILLLILAGFIFYFLKVKKENNTFKQDILNEKTALEKELNLTIKDLNSNQEQNIAITKDFNQANHKLKIIRDQLIESKNKIKALKNKLTKSTNNSYKELNSLRSTLASLRTNNQNLYKSLDSIKTLNDDLMVTIAITKSELNTEKLQSEDLALKLSDATKIQIAKVEVYAVEEKKSGELKPTQKHKKVNGIQVKYNVLNNKALTDTECDVFYVLKNADGVLIKASGEFIYKDTLTKFTDGTRLVLNGETMPVNDLISLGDSTLTKGTYTLEFYSVDGLLAKESFVLKNSFLGVF